MDMQNEEIFSIRQTQGNLSQMPSENQHFWVRLHHKETITVTYYS